MKKGILTLVAILTLGYSYAQEVIHITDSYYERGEEVKYYDRDGLQVFFQLDYNKTYGKYFRVNISIKNLSGEAFLFDPSKITATYKHKKKGMVEAEVLTYSEYSKKVKRKQTWNSIAVGLGEGLSTMNAGYSTSTTNTRSSGSAYGSTNTSGYVGSTYVNFKL